MPRLVRRAPLSERIQAYLNPYDLLLWLSEELNGNDWDDFHKEWSLPVGVSLNLVFIIARSNSGPHRTIGGDDVFGDYEGRRGSGWIVWICAFIVHAFAILSISNALYTFTRKRHYRLFEQSIDSVPSTPSAHRVKVDSSPMASSPLRFLSTIINANSAESRAHPDANRDVWEIAVWDPTPVCLRLFCLFSPGHVLVYWLFLPVSTADPRPSVTVVTTILLGILLSVQLSCLQSFFSQQSKDSAIIHKEVLNEYDTKFVHPSLNKPVRDVGTQTRPSLDHTPSKEKDADEMTTTEVDTYTPTTIINRGFKTNPNPAYSSQYYEDNTLQNHLPNRLPRSSTTPAFFTPASTYSFVPTPSVGTSPEKTADFSSPIRAPAGGNAFPRPPDMAFRHTLLQQNSPRKSDLGVSTGDGGSLGVYTHAASPLRKAASSNILRSREGAAGELRKREGSPLKRTSMPGFANGDDPVRGGGAALNQRFKELRGGERRRESGRF